MIGDGDLGEAKQMVDGLMPPEASELLSAPPFDVAASTSLPLLPEEEIPRMFPGPEADDQAVAAPNKKAANALRAVMRRCPPAAA